jgi:hypothetical protein
MPLEASVPYLSSLDAHVGEAERRTTSETNTTVTIAIARVRHGNLDVLQLSTLSNTPPESRESIAF